MVVYYGRSSPFSTSRPRQLGFVFGFAPVTFPRRLEQTWVRFPKKHFFGESVEDNLPLSGISTTRPMPRHHFRRSDSYSHARNPTIFPNHIPAWFEKPEGSGACRCSRGACPPQAWLRRCVLPVVGGASVPACESLLCAGLLTAHATTTESRVGRDAPNARRRRNLPPLFSFHEIDSRFAGPFAKDTFQ